MRVERLAADPSIYSARVADLPFSLADIELQGRLGEAVDREGKILRALEELGPIAGRAVALVDASPERSTQLERLGARVVDDGQADVAVSFWSAPGAREGAEERDLRVIESRLEPGGRLLVVRDYGRDDVWHLGSAEPEPDRRPWSRRDDWFLRRGFKLRVLHCWWTFPSLEEARELLGAAFGDAGARVADGLRRPRLAHKVAIFHHSAPLVPASGTSAS